MEMNCLDRKTQVKIRRVADVELPKYETAGASGLDLRAAISEPMTLKPMERQLVPTGIQIELERGWEAQVRPRSGMSWKRGLTLVNCIGTIDSDYRNTIMVPMINLSEEEQTIQPNDRIAQMVICPVEQVELVEVEDLSDTVRGLGGFGSTGVQ